MSNFWGSSTSQVGLAGPFVNREFLYMSRGRFQKKYLYQCVLKGGDIFSFSGVYISQEIFIYISGLVGVIYIFIQWYISRGWRFGTPGFTKNEAGSLSCPVIGPAFRPGARYGS